MVGDSIVFDITFVTLSTRTTDFELTALQNFINASLTYRPRTFN